MSPGSDDPVEVHVTCADADEAARIAELHSYEVPAMAVTAQVSVGPGYAEWVRAET